MPESDVTIVMVTHNSANALRRSLPALAPLAPIVVIDNASEDDTVCAARELAPQACVVENSDNLGFGRGNNLGLEQVATPFALLLNPDCIIDAQSLAELRAAAERYPQAALLAAHLYNPDGKSERSYGRPFFEEDGKAPLIEPCGDLCAGFLVGTALLLRMSLMRGVGFFDPAIFLYYEDDDLCLRVRAAGHALILVHGARALHLGGQSSPPSTVHTFRRYFYQTQSRLYLLRKYRGLRAARKEAFGLLAGSVLKFALYAVALNRTLMIRSLARIAAIVRTLRTRSSIH